MEAERKTQSARRHERQGLASVALVGYTNAGSAKAGGGKAGGGKAGSGGAGSDDVIIIDPFAK